MTDHKDCSAESAEALRLLAAEDARQDKLQEILETIREQIRLEVAPEHRPEGLFKNIQDAVYAMRGRTRLMGDAAITHVLNDAQPTRRGSMAAQFTYDPEGEAYYFAPLGAQPGPYYTQRHVNAILDIAFDGTLAGVELIDRVPPPPCLTSQPSPAATVDQERIAELQNEAGMYRSLYENLQSRSSAATGDAATIANLRQQIADLQRTAIEAFDRGRVSEPQSLPVQLTGEIACILEDCSPPEKQTPEALTALIEGYQPIWDRIRSALSPEARKTRGAE